MNAQEYFEKLDPPMREISIALQKIVLALKPPLKEEIKWKVPTYSGNIGVCSIMPHKKHVNLQIFQGAHINDSQKLEGTGKNMRHLKFSGIEEINRAEVESLLKQAIALDLQSSL